MANPKTNWSGFLLVGELGLRILFPILAYTFAGVYLAYGRGFGTWCVIAGICCGIVSAALHYYRFAKEVLFRTEDKPDKEENHED